MQIDKTSFNDISIFHQEEEYSIFHKLNFTRTVGGKEWLRRFFTETHPDLKRILGTQTIIKTLIDHLDEWPTEITNGTVIMMDKFLDYNLDPVSENQNILNNLTYQFFHSADYSMVKFSMKHFADFFRGLKKLSNLFSSVNLPEQMRFYLERVEKAMLEHPLKQNLYYANLFKRVYKNESYELVDIFSRFDAWYSMAMAVKTFELHFPN